MIQNKKSAVFLYTNEEDTEKEIGESISVTLTIYKKKLMTSTLKKEIEEAVGKCKDLVCSCIGRFNVVKMIIQPKEL